MDAPLTQLWRSVSKVSGLTLIQLKDKDVFSDLAMTADF